MVTTLKKVLKRFLPYSVYAPVRDAWRHAVSYGYVGNGYECPFCNGRFSRFLPGGYDVPVLKEKQVIGGGYRENAICPRCFSDDRERQVFLFLKECKSELFSQDVKLLHVAPEKNLRRKLRSYPNIDYLAVDLDSPLADRHMDITRIPLDSGSYDAVICNAVLEHIQDDSKAMRELHRVMKKGGFAVLQVPISFSIESTIEDPTINTPDDRERVFGQKNHVRIYGKDYVSRLRNAGFTVDVIDCSKLYDPSHFSRYGMIRDEKIFLCTK